MNPFRAPGPGRCFPFWQELLGCYVVNSSEDDGKGKTNCSAALEDYYECMHHKKEVRQRLAGRAPPDPRDRQRQEC